MVSLCYSYLHVLENKSFAGKLNNNLKLSWRAAKIYVIFFIFIIAYAIDFIFGVKNDDNKHFDKLPMQVVLSHAFWH